MTYPRIPPLFFLAWSVCSNGMPGVESSAGDACCPTLCGVCAGDGCGVGGNAAYCCTPAINQTCSERGSAPCSIGRKIPCLVDVCMVPPAVASTSRTETCVKCPTRAWSYCQVWYCHRIHLPTCLCLFAHVRKVPLAARGLSIYVRLAPLPEPLRILCIYRTVWVASR